MRVGEYIRAFLIAAFASAFSSGVYAQECGGDYSVKRGDYLSKISNRAYGDPQKWSLIYQANIKVIGDDPNLIMIGDIFRIPCLDAARMEGNAEIGGSTPGEGKAVQLLTADNYQPFTHRGLLNDGLVTHLVDSAFAANPDIDDYGIVWVNDWAAHLEPLLSEQVYDMGFPWLRPDCASTPEEMRCRNFAFSEPMFEMLVLLFTHEQRPVQFAADSDIFGKTLCRPAGYYTHDLNKDGRNWLRDGKIELEQPQTVEDCFRMLAEGTVDAVAVNEFTGRTAVRELGMDDDVEIVQTRPLSIEGLHIIVHKSHPDAANLIELANEGLRRLQESGEYDRIVDQHLAQFWAQFDS